MIFVDYGENKKGGNHSERYSVTGDLFEGKRRKMKQLRSYHSPVLPRGVGKVLSEGLDQAWGNYLYSQFHAIHNDQ